MVWFSNRSVHLEPGRFIAFAPTYIPKGFALVRKNRRKLIQLRYEGPDGTYITYRQVHLGETELRVNTENVAMEAVDFHGYEAYYYCNLGSHSLLWNVGNYSFMVSSNIDKETTLKKVESTKMEAS